MFFTELSKAVHLKLYCAYISPGYFLFKCNSDSVSVGLS